jgi:hypothetical protein
MIKFRRNYITLKVQLMKKKIDYSSSSNILTFHNFTRDIEIIQVEIITANIFSKM